ncbi:MAG: 4-alpha-glucanotransferase, partial [Candidatus Omnitrophota bacterium]
MKLTESFPKKHIYRFSFEIRTVATVLIIAFLAQDIVWAHPDPFINRNADNNKLATESLFKHATDDHYAAFLYETIRRTCETKKIALKDLTFPALKAILGKLKKEPWLNITEPSNSEVFVTFNGGNMLRFYDSKELHNSEYENGVLEELQMPEGSCFRIQYLMVGRLQLHGNRFPEEQVFMDHFRVSSAVRSSAKAYLSKPKGAIYTRRVDEIMPASLSPEDKRVEKIERAITFLYDQGGEFRRRANLLRTTITVIGLTDMRTNLLFSDLTKNVFRAIHAGRRRNVLYLSMNIVDKLDVKWLALFLNAGVRFLEVYNKYAGEFKSGKLSKAHLGKIHNELEDSKPLIMDDPYEKKLWDLSDIKEKLLRFADEDRGFKLIGLINNIDAMKKEASRIKADLEARFGRTPEEIGGRRFNPDDFREEYVGLANKYDWIASKYEIVGNRDDASEYYHRKADLIKLMQAVDRAFWPVEGQERLVNMYLRAGMYDDFLKELKIFLTGEGWPIAISEEAREAAVSQQNFRKDFIKNNFAPIRNEVSYLLFSHESMAPRRIRRDISRVYSEAMQLFDNFESQTKIVEKVSVEEKKSDAGKEKKNSFWTSIHRSARRTFRWLYRHRRGMLALPDLSLIFAKMKPVVPAREVTRDETIYEINARALGKRFSEISDEDIKKIRDDSGATILWMMGTWQVSPYSKVLNQYWCKKNNESLERTASAFSITDYRIAEDLGGEKELREFVKRANRLGLRIMLDVVPNHMAADTPLLKEHPEYFMSLAANLTGEESGRWIRENKTRLKLTPENNPCPIFQSGTFDASEPAIPEPSPENVFYFGRDAAFTNPGAIPWVDVVQFNYANAAMREYMRSVLFKAAELTNGGGIRLDMIFLNTKDYIYRNWFGNLPREQFDKLYAAEEFWKSVVAELKEKYPGIVILGEMYGSYGHGDLANYLGLDYYYEDYFFKCLTTKDINGLKNFLRGYVSGMGRVNFVKYLENHDSADRVISVLRRTMAANDAVPASLAAATLLYTLPGGSLVYRGQESGYSQWISNASLIRGPPEQEDKDVDAHYREIVGIVRNEAYRDIFRNGSFKLLDTAYPGDIVAFEREYNGNKAVIVVNYCNSELNNIKLNIDGREEVVSMPAWSSRVYLPSSGKSGESKTGHLSVISIAMNSRAGIENDFVSPVKAGINTDGTFLPHIQGRSEKDWGVLDFGSYKTFAEATMLMGQHIIQWLPMMMSSAGNSPYSVASHRIIDPKYIDIDGILASFSSPEARQFIEENREKIHRLHDSDEVLHDEIMDLKLNVLRRMWPKFRESKDDPLFREYSEFLSNNENEIKDDLLYLALKKEYLAKDGASGWDWRTWNRYDEGLSDFGLIRAKGLTNDAIEIARARHKDEIDFQLFVQFVARRQMRELVNYARSVGVEFAIDHPFAYDGADIWLNPQVFGLKKENGYKRLTTQGVPPEESNPKEQHWQFYPYDWSNPATIEFLKDIMAFYKDLGFVYNRKDHVLGYYRTYHLTQDVDNEMTLKNLGLWDEISQKVRNAYT